MFYLNFPGVFHFREYEAWLIPLAVGMAFGGLTLVLCRFILGRRRLAPMPTLKVDQNPDHQRDPFVYGSANERRVALRRGGNPVEILVTDAEKQRPPFQGWVVDRSTGGLCLTVAEEVQPGDILSIRTLNAPTTVPWIQLEVRGCRRVDGGWEIGCQFVKTPPWSILLLFG